MSVKSTTRRANDLRHVGDVEGEKVWLKVANQIQRFDTDSLTEISAARPY